MSETTMQVTPPPPPAPPVRPRPFRRSVDDRVFGGVCGGLGQYWNVDPVILRVAFGVSLLFGGFGLFAYLALWLLVPDTTAAPNVRISDSWGLRILGSILAFVAVAIGLGLLLGNGNNGAAIIGALVAGVVVWIAMSKRPQVAAEPPAPDTGYAYGGTGGYDTTVLGESLPPAPPRERSYLGLIGVCAAIAAAGLAMLLSGSPTAVMAAALLALGVTLLVGAFAGRGRWLLVFAVPLLMLLAAVSQVERMPITTGQVQWTPEAASSYTLTAGTLDVDFSKWQGQPDGDIVAVDMGLGEVRVAAPRNWEVRMITDIGAGAVEVNGVPESGRAVSGNNELVIPASSGKAEGSVTVDVTMQAGSVQVETGAPSAGTDPTPAPKNVKEKKA